MTVNRRCLTLGRNSVGVLRPFPTCPVSRVVPLGVLPATTAPPATRRPPVCRVLVWAVLRLVQRTRHRRPDAFLGHGIAVHVRAVRSTHVLRALTVKDVLEKFQVGLHAAIASGRDTPVAAVQRHFRRHRFPRRPPRAVRLRSRVRRLRFDGVHLRRKPGEVGGDSTVLVHRFYRPVLILSISRLLPVCAAAGRWNAR